MFKNLKIRWKIILSFIPIMLISFMIMAVVIVVIIKFNGDKEIETFRSLEMSKLKINLKNYVDIAYETIDTNYKNANKKGQIEKRYGTRLKNIIDLTEHIIKESKAKVATGEISVEEAKQIAASQIKSLRYDSGTGYIWINDTGRPYPKMIMHPTAPSLDGQILDDPKYNCALGKKQNLFAAFVDVTEKSGEGFVDYLWPKPTKDGLTTEQPKLSYVRLIKDWNWIIGTGIYVDDAIRDSVQRVMNDIKKMRYDQGVGYFWINDTGRPFPKMVMHPTVPSLDGKILDDPKYDCALGKKQNLFAAFVDVTETSGEGYVDYLWPKPTKNGLTTEQPKLSFVKRYEPLDWIIGTGVYIDDIDASIQAKTDTINSEITLMITVIVIVLLIIVSLAIISFWFISNGITGPIESSSKVARKVTDGDLFVEIEIRQNDEIGELLGGMRDLVRALRSKAEITEQISQGNLSIGNQMKQEMGDKLEKDILGKSILKMVQNLNNSFRQVKNAVFKVTEIAEQVSDSSQALSDGAVKQAASLEEMSSSLTQLASTANSNVEKAEQANRLVDESSKASEVGYAEMSKMVDAMSDITNASTDISKKIKVVDEIAFQTNLLALNAAVEAARAGRYGKGFAVVAEEVRNLANKSAEAAKDINEMIEGSIEKVNYGNDVAAKTAELLNRTKEIILKVSELVTEITASSKEQNQGIDEINKALEQVNDITQQNSASSEETASVAQELTAEASQLKAMLQRFQLADDDQNQPSTDSAQHLVAKSLPYAPQSEPESNYLQHSNRSSRKGGNLSKTIVLDDKEFGR